MTTEEFLKEWNNDQTRLLVHTSGSTGKPKPMWVEKQRMEASARITCDFLGLREGVTALLCMNLDYIAAKMMVVRAIVRNLNLISVPPTGHPLHDIQEDIDFAAMVPLQVYNSLSVPEERNKLMQIKHLIIGGGAIDENLAEQLKSFPNHVWSTYGMTETLSHIALRRLNGDEASEWYTPFESVNISLNEDSCLIINAPLVCDHALVTNDIAEIKTTLSEDGKKKCSSFKILGRKDNIICSGGIKIQIEEVERILKPQMPVPFLITKRADRKFGEIAVLLYESNESLDLNEVVKCLPKYWQPRAFVRTAHLPMTQTGKFARKEAAEMVRIDTPDI